MAIGTSWASGTWAAPTWADNTWADSGVGGVVILPTVNVSYTAGGMLGIAQPITEVDVSYTTVAITALVNVAVPTVNVIYRVQALHYDSGGTGNTTARKVRGRRFIGIS